MKKKLVILLLVLTLLTGCTKRFAVKDETTGKDKNYTSNILCKPTTESMKTLYNENEKKTNIKLDDLPECKNFNAFKSPYEGLWTSIFVKPLAMLIIKVGTLVGNYGISIMIVGLALRAIMFPLSKKSAMMSENMKKAQKDLKSLENKYKDKQDKEAMMMKSQEMMMIYKKHNISPISGCLFALIQLPLFLSFLEAVNRIPVFFEQSLWKYHLGQTPWEAISNGNYWYTILIILIIGTTFFSFRNMNMNVADESQAKQMAIMNKFMVVFISVASLFLQTAIALYWIVSNGFTVIQNILLKRGKENGKI